MQSEGDKKAMVPAATCLAGYFFSGHRRHIWHFPANPVYQY